VRQRCPYIAVEEEVIRTSEGVELPIEGRPITQVQAIQEAEKIYRTAWNREAFPAGEVPWVEILAPQVILYCLSKLLRSFNLFVRLTDRTKNPTHLRSTNPLVYGVFSHAGDRVHIPCTTKLRYAVQQFSSQTFPIYEFAGIWTKSARSNWPRAMEQDCRVLMWAQNNVHETTAFAVADALRLKGINAVCVVDHDARQHGVFNLRQIRTTKWANGVVRLQRPLRTTLRQIAKGVMEAGDFGASVVLKRRMQSVLEVELLRRFSVRAADAWVIAGLILDELKPASVLIQDVADFRTRTLAIEARRRKIPVIHHQFGDIAPECTDIEWGWDCVDWHCVWGEISAGIVERFSIRKDKIRITGTPRMRVTVKDTASPESKPCQGRTVLFPLSPASPLRFGNGGMTTLSENIEMVRILFRWAAKRKPTDRVVLKRRPLGDDEWIIPLLKEAPDNVDVLPGQISTADALKSTAVLVTTHSTVAIDAVMAGVPLVFIRLTASTDRSGHPYTRAGMAFDAFSEDELASALEVLFNEPHVRASMIAQQEKYRRSIVAYEEKESASMLAQVVKDTLDGNNESVEPVHPDR